jgi:hypothetical protein
LRAVIQRPYDRKEKQVIMFFARWAAAVCVLAALNAPAQDRLPGVPSRWCAGYAAILCGWSVWNA